MKWILTILLTACLLTACTTGTTTTNEDYQRGVGSLAYSFHPQAPPSEVLEQDTEVVVITVRNEGAQDITQGFVSLITDQHYLDIIGPNKLQFQAEGQNKENPNGDIKDMRFTIKVGTLDVQSQRHDVDLLASVCYNYATELNDVVCIDDDPYRNTAEKPICDVTDITSSGQGSPIVIDKVRVSMPKDTSGRTIPTFAIHFKNREDGIVVREDKVADLCQGLPILNEDLNTVSVYAELGEHELTCDTATIKMNRGEGVIRCIDTLGIDDVFSEYKTPIHIRLGYGYSDTIAKKIAIVR